jgi:hypothetical protein
MIELVNFVDLQEEYKNKQNNDPDMIVNFVVPKKFGEIEQIEADAGSGSSHRKSSLYDKIKQEEFKEVSYLVFICIGNKDRFKLNS